MANKQLIELSSKIVTKNANKEEMQEFLQVIDVLRQKGASNPVVLWEINEIITRTAEEILRPRVDFLDYIADVERVGHGQKIEFIVPEKFKMAMNWSGRGNTVDYKRVGNKGKVTIETEVITGGAYYEIDQLLSGNIDGFVGVVEALVTEMEEKISGRIITVLSAIMASAPTANKWVGANISKTNFDGVASTVQRYDRNTSVICDIDFAKKLNALVGVDYLSDRMKEDLNNNGLFGVIDGTKIITFTNTFTDGTNTELVAPRKYGFVVPTSNNNKIVKVGFEGGLEQYTSTDIESERVFLKVTQKVGVNVVSPISNIGFLEDTSLA